ncbi:MAG: DUF554 domain-containing protein [Firmicutes bacterium]|nr:DUF554 domain-containing protein [Bacillota bacterium]
MHGIGTIVNVITVVIGSSLGLLLGERLPKAMNEIAMQVLGAVTLVLGMQMALEGGSAVMMILVLLALVTGSFIGEWMDIEGIMNRLGERFEKRFNRDRSDEDAGARFVQGFVSASLLFCVGPMTILGSIQDGLLGDPSLLLTKAALDGVSSFALAAALGPGTLLSVLSIIVYQGGLTALAGAAKAILNEPVISTMTVTGGIMIVAIAINLWRLAHLRVGNMLPALLISGAAAAVAAQCGWL